MKPRPSLDAEALRRAAEARLREKGTASSLQNEADFKKRTGIVCSAKVPTAAPLVGRDHSTAVFRILQESLMNVVRHAHPTQTADKHRQHVMDKLDIHDTAGLTRCAVASRIAE